MQAKGFGALSLQHAVGVEKLFLGHAVLGVAGVIHDAVCELEQPARVEAAAYGLGDATGRALKEVDVGDIVKIDGGAKLACKLEVRCGRVVGREHDVGPRDAQRAGDHKLGIA